MADLERQLEVAGDAFEVNQATGVEALARAEEADARIKDLEAMLREVVEERDRYHEAADELAGAIAPTEVIGEHTNLNDPWKNAIDHLEAERAERGRGSAR